MLREDALQGVAAIASALGLFSLIACVVMTHALDVSSSDSNWLDMMSCVCVLRVRLPSCIVVCFGISLAIE